MGIFEAQEESCVVVIVDNIINTAISLGASDIHIESMENHLRIRYRIDGVLLDQNSIHPPLCPQIISRIKVLSNIDITQKRIPQDGKFKFFFNNNFIDLRVSTFPSIYGEKVVIRILDKNRTTIELEKLGFDPLMLAQFKKLINKSTGFILVTGPTGSGKTTTLYAAISSIHTPEKNIITLEDPVEYHLEGITQGQINTNIGFTFAQGIRSILRQDPDVALIGEIRDRESAKIAIEASLTGHLVFSTLHTNNAPNAIIRLMEMGIEPYLINASLTGVLAQRLARKICSHCCQIHNPTNEEEKLIQSLKINCKNFFKGKGCSHCFNLGYKGRIGIFELLILSNDLKSLIIQNPKYDAIYSQALSDGICTLNDDASNKMNKGLISLSEFVRIIS